MFGKPCIRDLRFTVADILDYLASGMTEQEILADFPICKPRTFERRCALRPIGNMASNEKKPTRGKSLRNRKAGIP